MADADRLVKITVAIVSAYARHNVLSTADLVSLLPRVRDSLATLSLDAASKLARGPVPSVPIDRSVTREHIVCLEDGKWFKTLTRHLSSVHGLTPQQYRSRWGLPSDYPMMSRNYAATRHRVAKETRR